MDAFKSWQFGKLNKIIYVSRGFYCRIKGALRVAACHSLIRPLDLVFQSKKNKKRTKMENEKKEKRESTYIFLWSSPLQDAMENI